MRVVWIIDGAYLLKGSQTKFSYLALRHQLQEWACEPTATGKPEHFKRTIYFNTRSEMFGDKQENFSQWLHDNGFEVREYPIKTMAIKCPDCSCTIQRSVQKGVDVGIATAIMSGAFKNEYDRLVLTAGDGDFNDAVRCAQDLGKEVWVAGFHGSMAGELRVGADKLLLLDNI